MRAAQPSAFGKLAFFTHAFREGRGRRVGVAVDAEGVVGGGAVGGGLLLTAVWRGYVGALRFLIRYKV